MTVRTAIKFCGLKDLETIRAAVACQVDALGFVFYDASPRAVKLSQLAAFQVVIPPFMTRVGLLVNPEAKFVETVIESHLIDVLQFHGQESGEFCEQFQFPYYKVLPAAPEVSSDSYWAEIDSRYPNARAFMLDTPDPKLHGGTGKAFDWSFWPQHVTKPLILAGGLTADNVVEAIQHLRPYAVDVSSGIEVSRGCKSAAKMAEFSAAVAQAGG